MCCNWHSKLSNGRMVIDRDEASVCNMSEWRANGSRIWTSSSNSVHSLARRVFWCLWQLHSARAVVSRVCMWCSSVLSSQNFWLRSHSLAKCCYQLLCYNRRLLDLVNYSTRLCQNATVHLWHTQYGATATAANWLSTACVCRKYRNTQ